MQNEYKSFYKTVKGNEGSLCRYSTRLDTYGRGCQHNCSYCYARSLLEFRRMWDAKRPAVADIGKIRVCLETIPTGTVLRLGGMTDTFMPLETRDRVTYETIHMMNDRGIHYLIVTKSDLVAEDEYIDLMDERLAHIQVSVTATGDETARRYENAAPISRRIRAIEKLYGYGFDVSIRLSPYIPELVDIERINAIKCDKILIEFLRVNSWVRKWMDIDYSEYTLSHGGYKHLPLELKRKYLEGITIPQRSVCDDVPEHWTWFRDNYNYNKEDCCNLRV